MPADTEIQALKTVLQQIQDRFAIQDLMAKFCHMVDTRILETLTDEIFTADAILDYKFKRCVGRDEIHNFYNSFDDLILGTSHTVANPLIQINGDTAIALHRVMGVHWHKQNSDKVEVRAADEIMIAGYQDRLRREPAGWRISERIIVQFGAGLGAGTATAPFDEVMKELLVSKAKWPF